MEEIKIAFGILAGTILILFFNKDRKKTKKNRFYDDITILQITLNVVLYLISLYIHQTNYYIVVIIIMLCFIIQQVKEFLKIRKLKQKLKWDKRIIENLFDLLEVNFIHISTLFYNYNKKGEIMPIEKYIKATYLQKKGIKLYKEENKKIREYLALVNLYKIKREKLDDALEKVNIELIKIEKEKELVEKLNKTNLEEKEKELIQQIHLYKKELIQYFEMS